jgi:hypothetical protein
MGKAYSWHIEPSGLSHLNGFADVYTRLQWELRVTDPATGATGRLNNMGTVYLPPPRQDSFIPKEDVTPEIMRAWLLDGLGGGVDIFKGLADMQLATFTDASVEAAG